MFPNVIYEIYEGSVNEPSQQLLSGVTELSILSVPLIHQNDFEVLFQHKEEVCAIFAKYSKFLTEEMRNADMVSLEDITGLPLCPSAGCHLIISKAHNIKPRILSICTTRTAALQWASDDYGVSIVPIELTEEINDQLVYKQIKDVDPDLHKTVVKVKGRPLSVIAKKFLKFYSEIRHSERVRKLNEME